MPEKDSASAVDHGDLALRAAVAYRVMNRVSEICNSVIEANASYIKDTKGVRSITAELPIDGMSMPLGTFTRAVSKPSFEITDPEKVLEYADEHDETEFVIRPAFLTALKQRLRYDPKTGCVFDSITKEVVEGFTYNPGGETRTVRPHWNDAGIEALDGLLGFIDAALEHLPTLTAANFTLPELEAGQ
ncbi:MULTISPECIES: hypothetical protein [unclassified Streptomyces]|uniref:hypothetical protein n=1 Tax=unclassified Streptomyces TaxID=2593676 RepID=UPI0035DD4E51